MKVSTLLMGTQLFVSLSLVTFGSAAFAGGPDTDGDGVPDAIDNCILVANPGQVDADSDSFGNFCDGDFNQDGIVNLGDLALMRLAFFTGDPVIDMNSDMIVNFADLQLFKAGFFLPPGPSANAVPTDIALDNASVDENQPAGTAVGTFTTADLNGGDTHTYTLVAGTGDTDNASFGIAGDVLETAAILDFETQSSFSIRVQTDDGNGGQYEEVFTITVNDLNDDPTDIALDSTDVDENQPAGTAVGTFSTTDQDATDTHTYTLVAGVGDTDNASFGIAGNLLETAAIFDFETQSSFSIRVQTDDGNGGQHEEVFTITVNDLNDAPTDIALDSTDVDENQPAGTAVGTFSSTDVDSAGPFNYTLVAGAGDTDNGSFGITGGVLETGAIFDFETQSSYSVRVQTDDGAGGTYEEVFTITVNDLNDDPTDIALDSTDVDENQPAGTAVGTLSTTDVDSAGPFTYTLVAGIGDTDNASFGVTGDVLETAAIFDFDVQSSFSIRVQTDDGSGGLYEEVFTITVNSLNNDPTDIALSNASVDENQPSGTAVGTFTTTDIDPDTHTYTLVAGAGDTDNASFGISGNVLETAAIFNFEAQSSYSIRVETDDGAGGKYEEAFTITVNDLNEDPTDIALSNASVDENEPAATAVGTFTTTDMDAADTHTYTLVAGTGDTDNGDFTIVGDELQTMAVLNFEATTNCMTSASTCSIRVQTNDGNGGLYSESFIIDINNVNDAPVAVADPYSGAIGNVLFELIPAIRGGTPVPPTVQVVGTIVSNDTDEDTADTLTTTANASIATTQGGTVALDANGRFVYTPAVGFPGTGVNVDQFTYEVCDNGAPIMCDNGTVTIEGTGIVWFVDDSSPNNPGTGVAGDAFRDLSSASGAPTAPGEIIFVYSGTHTTGITLQNNQSLLGQGLNLVVGGHSLVDGHPSARPVIANAGGTAITLGASNTIRGLDITGSVRGIFGSSGGTLTADNVAIDTTGGPGIDLTGGAGLVTFDSVSSSTSSGKGIDLDSVSGTFSFGSGSISGSTGNAFEVSNSTAVISYGGTITASSARPVDVINQSANGVDLSGLITSTSQGVFLSGNTGGTITFRGGLDLNTGSNIGFSATGGGTVNVCADTNCETAGGTPVSNLVTTSGAKGINIQNTLIGVGGVTFDDVDVDGGSAGIDIENAGSGGFFTVNGGFIRNTTVNGILIENTDNITINFMQLTDAADDGGAGCSTVSFSCRAAMEFNTVSTIDISDTDILRSDEHGIFGTNVTDLDLTNVSVTNAGQTNEEHGIFIRNLLGTAADGKDSVFDNVDITNSGSNGIFVENTTGTNGAEATPDLLTITGTSSVINHGTNSGIIVESDASAANLKLDVQSGYQSTNNSTRGVSANANAGRLQATVNGATFGGGGHFLAIGGGSAAAGADSELILNLTNNIITQVGTAGTGPGGIAFSSFSTGAANGTMRGTIQGNTIGSASNTLCGICLTNEGNSTANRFLIDDNTITFPAFGSSGMDGMRLQSRTKQGSMDLILTNNVISIPNNTDDFTGGIVIFAGNGTPGEANTVCVKMANNNVNTPAKDAAWSSEHEYAIIGLMGNTIEIDSFAAEGIPVTDAGIATYVSPGTPNNFPGTVDGVNIAGNTSVGINTAVQIVGGTLLDGTCTAP